jgi:hypothetical protein
LYQFRILDNYAHHCRNFIPYFYGFLGDQKPGKVWIDPYIHGFTLTVFSELKVWSEIEYFNASERKSKEYSILFFGSKLGCE